MSEASNLINDQTKMYDSSERSASKIIELSNSRSRSGTETMSLLSHAQSMAPPSSGSSSSWSLFNIFLGRKADHNYSPLNVELNVQRKVPIKVEPKVFFANERTFLAWMHMSVTIASISVAIVAFAEANEWSTVYGLILLPVAISFCVYSLWMYLKRGTMIKRKDPGPYDDTFGPTFLASILAIAIAVNFFVKLYEMST